MKERTQGLGEAVILGTGVGGKPVATLMTGGRTSQKRAKRGKKRRSPAR
jgi:hypothetical protein